MQPFQMQVRCDECYETCIAIGDAEVVPLGTGDRLALKGTVVESSGCPHARRFLGAFETVAANGGDLV